MSNNDPTVSMTLLGVVTTNRPPVSEVTVRVTNDGDVTVRPRLSAVDDWSPAGPVPAQPPELELRRGRHRDVRVRIRRPLVAPIGRQRRGSVTVYTDVDGRSIPGPVYDVPPLVGRVAVLVAVAVLAVGLAAVFLRAAGRTERPQRAAPGSATAVVEPPGATPAGPGATSTLPAAPADPDALPADVVFDAPVAGDADTHTPVLVSRDGSMVFLPPGGRVTAGVKVPSGWIVKRQAADSGTTIRARVFHVRDGEVLDLAPGVRDPSFWVDASGARVAIDGRSGTDGVVTVLSLRDAVPETSTVLPAHVRLIAWVGAAMLTGVRDASGSWEFGRWPIGDPYEELPSAISGSFLGTVGGAVTIHQRDGELDCIVQVTELVRPAKQALRCGFGVPVDTGVLTGRWSAVSPGGRFLAVPGPSGSAYFAPLPAMLKGLVGFAPAVGLPGPVHDIAWRDGATAAVLVGGGGADTQIWVCDADSATCRATPVVRPDDLSPALLVARVPA